MIIYIWLIILSLLVITEGIFIARLLYIFKDSLSKVIGPEIDNLKKAVNRIFNKL